MSTIYLVQQGGVVTKKQSRFQIKVADEPQQDIPIREISKLLLYGNIHLTTPVISTGASHFCSKYKYLDLESLPFSYAKSNHPNV